MSRWAAVLAGGSGTRFWPLSMPAEPKQFQRLAGSDPLLVQSVRRLSGLIEPDRVLIVTSAELVDRTRAVLPEIPSHNVLGEPKPASTAAALTWATYIASSNDESASVLSVHADWFISDDDEFRSCADAALAAASRHDVLVTVGIRPTRIEIGYGYILPGERLEDGVYRVNQFVEKPKYDVAAGLIEKEALWNCGMFAWTAERFFAETRLHAPEIASHMDLLERETPASFFSAVTPIVIDKSHMERSERVAVVPGTFPWDDIGTWNALPRVQGVDRAGNNLVEGVFHKDSANCIVWPDGERVALYGVSDLVVARAHGITLVTTRERADDLKQLVEDLPPDWKTTG